MTSVKENETKDFITDIEMTNGNRMKLRNIQIVRSGGSVVSLFVFCSILLRFLGEWATDNCLKWMSLFILTLQNTGQVLLMRYARTRFGYAILAK